MVYKSNYQWLVTTFHCNSFKSHNYPSEALVENFPGQYIACSINNNYIMRISHIQTHSVVIKTLQVSTLYSSHLKLVLFYQTSYW